MGSLTNRYSPQEPQVSCGILSGVLEQKENKENLNEDFISNHPFRFVRR